MAKISIELKWAFIFIAISLAWMVLEKMAGLHDKHIDKHQYLTLLFAVPAITTFVLALRDKKKNYYNNRITYKQAFISGLIITGIVTAFSPLTQWIISEIITPEYFPNVIEHAVNTGYFKTRAEAENYFNLGNYIKQSVVGAFVMGLITTVVVSFFIKTRKKAD